MDLSEKNRRVQDSYDHCDKKITTTTILLFKRLFKNYLQNTKLNIMIIKKKSKRFTFSAEKQSNSIIII